jgi:hypothetical protein
MNCQEARNQMPDLLRDGLEAADAEAVRGHIHSCRACWQEWSELHETWTRLGLVPEERPSPQLRREFYRRLEASRRTAAARLPWRERLRRLLPDLRALSPAMRLAAAALVVTIGFAAGFSIGSSRRDGGRVEVLNQEVDRLKQQVSLSLLAQPSASARLQGLSMTANMQDPEPALLHSLLDVLDNDPNVNVRLSAVDALYLFSDREEVRTALAASLNKQTSPLVQIALIDLMVSIKEKRAAAALRQLMADGHTMPEVRQRAQTGISKIL